MSLAIAFSGASVGIDVPLEKQTVLINGNQSLAGKEPCRNHCPRSVHRSFPNAWPGPDQGWDAN